MGCGTGKRVQKPISFDPSQIGEYQPDSFLGLGAVDKLFYMKRKKVTLSMGINKSGQPQKQTVDIVLTEPIEVGAQMIRFNVAGVQRQMFLSRCVLPGQDPHGTPKPCQDDCTFVYNDGEAILLALFDGHGRHGTQVSNKCIKVAEDLFSTKRSYRKNRKKFLSKLVTKCDKAIQDPVEQIDIDNSGTTCVMALYYNGRFTNASVGDSRAVLGTVELPKKMPAPTSEINQTDIQMLSDVRRRRSSMPSVILRAVQLTKDQKPEDPDELERIQASGGTVLRLQDNGVEVGPYRVFQQGCTYPGIAMSRSIGDHLGKDIGIICDPIITTHSHSIASDKFIILASDGIWDVMDNQEAVNFVEAYRHSCTRHVEGYKTTKAKIRANNSIIAHLLCEEARVRWFTIVEHDDVLIDDISCVILELDIREQAIGLLQSAEEVTSGPLIDASMPHSPVSKQCKKFGESMDSIVPQPVNGSSPADN